MGRSRGRSTEVFLLPVHGHEAARVTNCSNPCSRWPAEHLRRLPRELEIDRDVPEILLLVIYLQAMAGRFQHKNAVLCIHIDRHWAAKTPFWF